MPLRDNIDQKARAMSLGYQREHADPEKRACRWCGGPVPKGRRSWCSEACVHEALMRAHPGYARSQVEKRDHGICAVCGLDCGRLERLVDRLLRLSELVVWVRTDTGATVSEYWREIPSVQLKQVPHPAANKALRNLELLLVILGLWAGHDLRKWTWHAVHGIGRRDRLPLKHSLWQADHIRPVVEGGGGCGLDNYRTLCLRCHKRATAALATRRADAIR
jgi:hypothetical protein